MLNITVEAYEPGDRFTIEEAFPMNIPFPRHENVANALEAYRELNENYIQQKRKKLLLETIENLGWNVAAAHKCLEEVVHEQMNQEWRERMGLKPGEGHRY